MTSDRGAAFGNLVGGSLTGGLEVRVEPEVTPVLGQYVRTTLGDGRSLIGMVTDISLKAAEPAAVAWPPAIGEGPRDRLLRDVLTGTAVFTAAEVTPYLELAPDCEPVRARSLPRHFETVQLADQSTVDAAFRVSGDAVHLGSPLGMADVEVCLDLERLFERSAGVFGKSGTGKTVLTLQLLDAVLARTGKAPTSEERTVALIFDMHNDYGRSLKFEGGHRRSLREKHPADLSVYGLEAADVALDGRLEIGTRDIDPDDLAVLQSAGHFTQAAVEAAFELQDRLGKDWVDELLSRDPSDRVVREAWGAGDKPDEINWARVAGRLGIHPASLDSLRRGLRHFERRKVVRSGSSQFAGGLDHIVKTLQGGKSAVIQFGRYGSDLVTYMLVANMLSRRIWERYRDAVERASRDDGPQPNRLVIVVEEAHKFMDRGVAGFGIFGQIARELRKYNVTLLVIDQRPSRIDPEVLSQIGTKFCFQLDSDSDVESVVGGVAGRRALRQVIATLESRQQSLVFGHALAMPVVVRTAHLGRDDAPGAGLRPASGAVRPGFSFRERLEYSPREPASGNPLFG